MRQNWCKEEFKHVIASKHYEESFAVVDETLGTYHTFGSLVVALGGWSWKPAIIGAKLHFIKACLETRWFFKAYQGHVGGLDNAFALPSQCLSKDTSKAR